MSSSEESPKTSNAFRVVMIWTGVILFTGISFGFLYRIIYPVELHLAENEYTERVFVETETNAWRQPMENSTLVGTYDAGSVLYVLDEDENFFFVRPLIVSKVDSVWVAKDSTTAYTEQAYADWLHHEERVKYGLE